MTNKLAVFDFDSTLMDGETLEFFAKESGIQEKVKEITDKAMRGELDFFESLTERVSYLRGLSVEKVNEICHNLPIMNGAKEVVSGLKSRGYK
ncbi:HAD-IB family phosphatase, partial [bacterium]|nr:HAD-IB family phosphatase [bacterium]